MSGDGTEKARENYERYQYARDNGHSDFLELAQTCLDYARGKQWTEQEVNALKAIGAPVLTMDQITPTLRTIMGEYLSSRTDVSFRPAKNGTEEIASALTKTCINIANSNKLDEKENTNVMNALITGRAYYDVRLEYDDQMMGEARITTIRPQNVLLNPDIDSPDPATWPDVIVSKWLSYNDIALLYGDHEAKQLEHLTSEMAYERDSIYDRARYGMGRGGGDPKLMRQYRVIERQHKQLRYAEFFVDPEMGDMRQVPDAWSREQIARAVEVAGLQVIKRRTHDVRWTVSVDNRLLHDDWSPYEKLTVVPMFCMFLDGQSRGVVETLISPQDLLNKTMSQELRILNTTANSGYKVKTGSLQNMSIYDLEKRGSEHGVVFELDDIDNLEKLQPNSTPTGHDRMSFKAGELIKEISGVTDTMRGMDREDVSSKAIVAKSSQSRIPLALFFDNVNRTRQALYEHVLDLVQSNYTEERIINITGGTPLAPRQEQITVNEVTPEGTILLDLTVGEYSVVLSPAPARANFNESQFAELIQLRELGVQIPPELLIEYSNVADKRALIDSIKQLTGQTPSEADQQQAALQQEMMQLEAQLMQLEGVKAQAEADLARARAAKATVDAAAMPEQAAAQARQQEVSAEQARVKAILDAKKIEHAEVKDKRKTALELTKLESQERQTKEKASADKEKAKAQATAAKNKPKPKPAARSKK